MAQTATPPYDIDEYYTQPTYDGLTTDEFEADELFDGSAHEVYVFTPEEIAFVFRVGEDGLHYRCCEDHDIHLDIETAPEAVCAAACAESGRSVVDRARERQYD